MRTAFPLVTSISFFLRLMVGGVVSFSSSFALSLLHAIKNGVARNAAISQTRNSFFQFISFDWYSGTSPVVLNAGLEGEGFRPQRSNVILSCAYLRTAAISICLHIPMQHNMIHFPFPVLAPSLRVSPFPPARL